MFSATPRRVATVRAARRRARVGTSMRWSSGNVNVDDWWSWRVEARSWSPVLFEWVSRNPKGRYDPDGEFGGETRKLSRSFGKGGVFELLDEPEVKAGGRRSSRFS